MNTKFDLNKCQKDERGNLIAQTRDGRKVRILCTDAEIIVLGQRQPILGLVAGNSMPISWSLDGVVYPETLDSPHNLINIPEKRKLAGFVIVTSDGRIWARDTKAQALNIPACGGEIDHIAIIDLSKYNIEYEVGEGLEDKQ